MKTYSIISGVNGVGKSSLTGVLSSIFTDLGTVINPNAMAAACGGNKFIGGKKAVALLDECIRLGADFTQETTLSGHQPVVTARKAKENDYYIRLFYVGLDTVNESLARIRNRVSKGGHDIPAGLVEARFAKRFSDLAKILPLCSEVHLFDNENGFREAAEYRNGRLIILTETPPAWITDFKKYLIANE